MNTFIVRPKNLLLSEYGWVSWFLFVFKEFDHFNYLCFTKHYTRSVSSRKADYETDE